ncbi:flavin monoamine oxidase family protein [Paucibacter sp. DJ2R-2]|uniref:flavin monoamine oxidase family protein n=1 Tax=Paucibacter sp. DJ2R-2 TaxID=2893558 RepID=UPI0021E3682D|nr:FAD-dependent oxidoreductase [Paucibacter sp. DJ2R-2]MCV2422499.1 FAD-dependent oxidoreductase [Paucibacter sp. DJ4R-1]MCV2440349.1 FAD-dependent oxidoreductase [Paucibacter sp. DJ2R-2]
MALRRRELMLAALAGGGSALLQGCQAQAPDLASLPGGWLGASAERGHRLRQPLPAGSSHHSLPTQRRQVLIVGGGIAGLGCARGLSQAGIDDFALLELEDEVGGNSRGHRMGGMACPMGAHYLPLPGPHAREVYQLLEELGLVHQELGRPVWDERQLCHSPQERLYFQGQWLEGLLPPARSPAAKAQLQQFEQAVERAQRELGFAMPSHRLPWTAGHAALDAQTFAEWLNQHGLDDPQLRWYLDYCCRDDFGAGPEAASAWAGLHYFASRHGFHPPGSDTSEREPVLTWPQGNAFLSEAIAAPLQPQIERGRTVLHVETGKHEITLRVWNEAAQREERWQCQQLVLATPLFVAQRLLGQAVSALNDAVALQRHAPWLVANLQLKGPMLQGLGVAPSWDNVIFGSQALGYVDAMHQSLKPVSGPTVISAYWALPQARRGELLRSDWHHWLTQVLAELTTVHPDLPELLQRADLVRWGHAMSIPSPGLRGSRALQALRRPQGRIHFAHSDLAGYSVFEEAYTRGCETAVTVAKFASIK